MNKQMTKQEELEYAATLGLSNEACVAAIGNRYDLVLVAARRARELGRGDAKRVDSKHGITLTTLKEIEYGKVTRDYLYKEQDLEPRRRYREK